MIDDHPDLAELPLTLKVEEAAPILRISRGLAYEGVRTGAIPSIKIGRAIRIPRRALLELLGENEPASETREAGFPAPPPADLLDDAKRT